MPVFFSVRSRLGLQHGVADASVLRRAEWPTDVIARTKRGEPIMKLGEALRLRSDNYKKIDELRTRAVAGAQLQEGQEAADSPGDLLLEIERLALETLKLVQRINRTNVATRLESGQPLVDALSERDYYLAMRSPFEGVASAASTLQQRYMRSELKSSERSIRNRFAKGSTSSRSVTVFSILRFKKRIG